MNVCDCPEPPGGNVTCRDDQLAICGYRDGKIVSGCYDRPGYIRLLTTLQKLSDNLGILRLDNFVLCNWIISTTTGSPRADVDPIDDSQLVMLRSGKYERWTGEVVNFSLPRIIQLDLDERVEDPTVWSTRERWRETLKAHELWRDSLKGHELAEWMNSVAEVSHRLHRAGRAELERMNRALAELRVWYERVVSASPEALAEEKNRLRDAMANPRKGLLKRWIGAEKKQSDLSGLRRPRQDVAAMWVELLRKPSV